ncbi:phage protein [Salmonella enterica subsp. arizonae]|nr:phage protein [Salmonella enterica subsp. arizonae]
MTTITNNKLTDEEITALALKLFDGSSFYFQSGRRPGAKTMAELLNKAASAVAELQERRKADSAEPAGYHVIKECGKVGCSVTTLEEAEKTRDFWNKRWTIRPYFYTQPALVATGATNSPVTPDGWISCSERMPEDEQEVIVQNKLGYRYISYFDEQSGLFFDMRGGNQINCIEHILVTHWMPLPAAPQQEVNHG